MYFYESLHFCWIWTHHTCTLHILPCIDRIRGCCCADDVCACRGIRLIPDQLTHAGPAVNQSDSWAALGFGEGISVLLQLSHTHTHTPRVSGRLKIAAVQSRWKALRETCCQSVRTHHTDNATKREWIRFTTASSDWPQCQPARGRSDPSETQTGLWHKGIKWKHLTNGAD